MNKKGFTLIEMLIVITLIAVITVMIIPGLMDSLEASREEKYNSQAKLLASNLKYYNDKKEYELWENANSSYIKVDYDTIMSSGSEMDLDDCSKDSIELYITKIGDVYNYYSSVSCKGKLYPSGKKPNNLVLDDNPITSDLPSGYTRLEYLENSGTQYIDTGYQLQTKTVSYELAFELGQDNASSSLFGSETTKSGNSVRNFSGVPYSTNLYFYVGQSTGLFSFTAPLLKTRYLFTVNINNNKINASLNNEQKEANYSDTVINGSNIYLFSNHCQSGVCQISKNARFYYFIIKDNGVVKRHMIPAKRNSDKALGMYDLKSGNFYVNKGSGSFIEPIS